MAKIPTDFYYDLPIDRPIIIRKLPDNTHQYYNLADKLAEIEKSTTNRKEVWHKAYQLIKNS